MFLYIDFRKIKKILKFVIFAALILAFFVIAVRKYFPVKHLDIIEIFSDEYGLRKEFLCAVIRAESGFKYKAESHKGARGLMQIMKQTADWGAEEIGISDYDYEEIFKPELNVRIGSWYLNRLINQYEGNEQTALAAYNAGSGNVSKWLEEGSDAKKNIETIPFSETREYIKRVQCYEKIYKILIKFY